MRRELTGHSVPQMPAVISGVVKTKMGRVISVTSKYVRIRLPSPAQHRRPRKSA